MFPYCGLHRQTQTQHRLPRSYYGGQRIYKMASTGDLVIQVGALVTIRCQRCACLTGLWGGQRRGQEVSQVKYPLKLYQLYFSLSDFTCSRSRFASREDRGSRGELSAAVRCENNLEIKILTFGYGMLAGRSWL